MLGFTAPLHHNNFPKNVPCEKPVKTPKTYRKEETAHQGHRSRLQTNGNRSPQSFPAEDAYVLSTKPELASLKEDGIPKHRYPSELGQVRAQLEAASDKQLAALAAETARRQAALESRFPEAFESVDTAVKKRQAIRKSLNDDPEFQDRNRAVVNAGQAIKDYEQNIPSINKISPKK